MNVRANYTFVAMLAKEFFAAPAPEVADLASDLIAFSNYYYLQYQHCHEGGQSPANDALLGALKERIEEIGHPLDLTARFNEGKVTVWLPIAEVGVEVPPA